MEIAGYLASALIGVSLGLIGGGGSILTVPVLVYLFGIHPLLATSYSLFIVGTTSLIGSYNNFKNNLVSVKTALYFGAASIITVFLTRKFLVPNIPHYLFTVAGFEFTSSVFTMVLFAILMLAASISMIKNGSLAAPDKECTDCIKFLKLLGYGVAIGVITGLLGAGGGFLLIPALVFLVKLPMKKAIGTSLLIIALNSLIGFAGDLGHFQIDWIFLLTISAIAIAGIFIGGIIGKKIAGDKLKKGFGWFVLLMGIYILIKEIYL
ncbi:sulfite exporter TauE/SafE family protein [Pedobacter glucosidilyticus]|uniref:sulfite exporter TauE/SafE family protein n=1 Tax=Pedobacter glucosidilyticus TaxID=1122941 RepID=UPI0026F1C8E9|nr:sulfite exporter TauE/SafE family protein [Pedobacter glucosidilyticus]